VGRVYVRDLRHRGMRDYRQWFGKYVHKEKAMTIYKYLLQDTQNIELPKGARILSVGQQKNMIFIWAVIDPTQPKEIRRFHVFGTGHLVPEHIANCGYFIGTVHLFDGALVFHVFEDFQVQYPSTPELAEAYAIGN
jgi:hypothetical protein